MASISLDRASFPVTSPLTDGEVRRLRALLVEERDTLRHQLAGHASALVELGQEGTDVERVERELVGLHAARARDMIEEVDGALSRLADGSYGACASCGRPIPFERLEAIPRARCCVACSSMSALRR